MELYLCVHIRKGKVHLKSSSSLQVVFNTMNEWHNTHYASLPETFVYERDGDDWLLLCAKSYDVVDGKPRSKTIKEFL